MPSPPQPTASPGAARPGVRLRGVSKAYRSGRRSPPIAALAGIDLDVAGGEFVSIIGPSGCGKSTLLRVLAGLVEPDEGTVEVLGTDPQRAAAAKQLGLVPQSPALLPWRSVLDNVRLPFQVNRGAGRAVEGVGDPTAILEAVGLGDVLDRRPDQLSGGMQQRVAIARAFVFGAALLLMDEPFSALDELTREALRHQLLGLWQAHRSTVVFVTHSVTEAVTLSDRVVVMSGRPGQIRAVVPVGLPRPRGTDIELSDAHRAVEATVRAELRRERTDAA
jgi:NitT/TauT family transport system ATP-binding protein